MVSTCVCSKGLISHQGQGMDTQCMAYHKGVLGWEWPHGFIWLRLKGNFMAGNGFLFSFFLEVLHLTLIKRKLGCGYSRHLGRKAELRKSQNIRC